MLILLLLLSFSHSVISDSLWPQGLQHARLPCPSLSPRVCSKLMSVESMMPSNHLLLSSDFPSIRVFSNNWLFTLDGLSIGASVSASVLPMNIQCWFPLGLTDLISLIQGTLKSLLQHHSLKDSILRNSAFFTFQLSHPYVTTGKTMALTAVMSLLFNTLSRFIMAFLPRSKRLLISWLESPSAVI